MIARKRARLALVLGLGAVLAILVIALAAKSPSATQQAQGGAPGSDAALAETAKAETAKAVRTLVLAPTTLKPYLDSSGDVAARINVAAYPDIGGKLVEYKVALGDFVEKGQTLALVDPSKPGSSYALSAVASPITGTVTAIPGQPGQTVSSSTSVASVGIVDDLLVTIRLSEKDSAKPRAGMAATVSLAALPGEALAARVSKVSPVLDATSRTRELSLVFSKDDRRVIPGMFAQVRLYLDPLAGRLAIPSAAVITRDGKSLVFVVESKDGKSLAASRKVQLGVSVDGMVEVTSGLAAGDRVIVSGQDLVADGGAVSDLGGQQ